MTTLIILACTAQIILAVVVLYFITQVRGLTPRWPWEHAGHMTIEKVMRAGICLAWIGYLSEIVYLWAALLLDEIDSISFNAMGSFGERGLLLALLFGSIILGHFAWLAWRADFRRLL